MKIPSREEALELLRTYTKNDNLLKHAFAVEAAMRFYARHFKEDEELWGVVGLLHDIDYEQHPTAEEHPFEGARILRELGYDESMINAILSHASYTGIARDSKLAKVLFAVDELCGFVIAVALVRPSKKIEDVKVKSIKKKMKDKAFARNVDREEIIKGAEDLGLELDEHLNIVVKAMQSVSDQLGL